MSIDSATGAILWEPSVQQTGSHAIQLQARNVVGTAAQEFEVIVPQITPVAGISISAISGGTLAITGTGTMFDGARLAIPGGALTADTTVSFSRIEGLPEDASAGWLTPAFLLQADGPLPVDASLTFAFAEHDEATGHRRVVRAAGGAALDGSPNAWFPLSIVRPPVGVSASRVSTEASPSETNTCIGMYAPCAVDGAVSILIRVSDVGYDESQQGPFEVWASTPQSAYRSQYNYEVLRGLQAAYQRYQAFYAAPATPPQAIVVIEPLKAPGVGGQTLGPVGNCPALIEIDSNIATNPTPFSQWSAVHDTAAHEYFHAVQQDFTRTDNTTTGNCGSPRSLSWLFESTAEFMADAVWPEHIYARTYAPFSWKLPIGSLTPLDGPQRYQMLLFWKYLSRLYPTFDQTLLWKAPFTGIREQNGLPFVQTALRNAGIDQSLSAIYARFTQWWAHHNDPCFYEFPGCAPTTEDWQEAQLVDRCSADPKTCAPATGAGSITPILTPTLTAAIPLTDCIDRYPLKPMAGCTRRLKPPSDGFNPLVMTWSTLTPTNTLNVSVSSVLNESAWPPVGSTAVSKSGLSTTWCYGFDILNDGTDITIVNPSFTEMAGSLGVSGGYDAVFRKYRGTFTGTVGGTHGRFPFELDLAKVSAATEPAAVNYTATIPTFPVPPLSGAYSQSYCRLAGFLQGRIGYRGCIDVEAVNGDPIFGGNCRSQYSVCGFCNIDSDIGFGVCGDGVTECGDDADCQPVIEDLCPAND
jgi:hypothetical protein